MKHSYSFFAALLVALSLAQAQQSPSVVRVKPGYATVIVCPSPPELVTVGSPEQFSTQSTGNYVLVKPVVSSGSTNMFIKSGSDSYNLVLQVSSTPDLEIRLQSSTPPPTNGSTGTESNGIDHASDKPAPFKAKDLEALSPKTRAVLSSYLKTPRPYAYSVVNSGVTFAVDHMVMVENRLHVICTIVNGSRINYDVGFVRFKAIEHVNSFLLFKKKVKEEEIEPAKGFYSPSVKPGNSARLLFVFDKLGFSSMSTIEIKCTEESGRRDLSLSVPAGFVE